MAPNLKISFWSSSRPAALSASNLSLNPISVSKTHLSGRIVPQNGSNLNVIGTLFSQFLSGENVTLRTRGDSVQPPGASGPVDWLSAAFKTLTLDVILPGEKLQVIVIRLCCADLLISRNTVIVCAGYPRNQSQRFADNSPVARPNIFATDELAAHSG